MTNKEAIEVIGQFSRIVNNESWLPDAQKAIKEASSLAINALEENDRLRSDNDELKDQMNNTCEHLAWYINERNRLIARLKEAENETDN